MIRPKMGFSFYQEDLPSVVLNSLAKQRNNSTFCDVILKVYSRQVKAHSNVLAAASPYFQSFFTQDIPRDFSQQSPQIIEILIEGATFEKTLFENAVEDIVMFMYTGRIDMNTSYVQQILELSKIMKLHQLVGFHDKLVAAKDKSCQEVLHSKLANPLQ